MTTYRMSGKVYTWDEMRQVSPDEAATCRQDRAVRQPQFQRLPDRVDADRHHRDR